MKNKVFAIAIIFTLIIGGVLVAIGDETGNEGIIGEGRYEYNVKKAYFEVSISIKQDEVEKGEVVEVDYSIMNTGNDAGIQDIEFRIDDELKDTNKNLTLEPNEVHLGTFEWRTDEDTYGSDHFINVSSDNDFDFSSVYVLRDPSFEIQELRVTPDEMYYDQEMTVEADLQNHGDIEGNYTVEFEIEGEEICNKTVTVPGGETVTVGIDYTPEESDIGERIVSVKEPFSEEYLEENVSLSDNPKIKTERAIDVGLDEAKLIGNLTEIGLEDSVEAYFRYKEEGDSSFTEKTNLDTIGDEGEFDQVIAGLESNTTYQFMAVVEYGTTEITGEEMTFTTQDYDGENNDEGVGEEEEENNDEIKDEEDDRSTFLSNYWWLITFIGIVSIIVVGMALGKNKSLFVLSKNQSKTEKLEELQKVKDKDSISEEESEKKKDEVLDKEQD